MSIPYKVVRAVVRFLFLMVCVLAAYIILHLLAAVFAALVMKVFGW